MAARKINVTFHHSAVCLRRMDAFLESLTAAPEQP